MKPAKPIEPGCRCLVIPAPDLNADLVGTTGTVVARIYSHADLIKHIPALADSGPTEALSYLHFLDYTNPWIVDHDSGNLKVFEEIALMRIDDDDQIAKDDAKQKSKPRQPVIVR